jgi:hypothetical protein
MKSMTREFRSLLSPGAAAVVMLSAAGMASAQESQANPMIVEILRAWEGRFQKVKAIRYEIEGDWIVPRETLAGHAASVGAPPPTGPLTKPLKYMVILDFEKRRGRIERQSWHLSLDDVKKQVTAAFSADIGVWDGDEGRGMADRPDGDPTRGSPKNPDMIVTRDPRFKTIHPSLRPLFWGHGGVTTLHGEVKDPELRVRYEADLFTVAGRAAFRGITCTVLKTEPRPGGPSTMYDELWIDRSREAAVLKRSTFTGKQLSSSEEAEYQMANGVSLVKSWSRSTFRRGSLVEEYRMRVASMDPNYEPKADDFRLEPKPGMFVQRNEEVFRVEPSGRWVKVGNDPDTESYYREHGHKAPPPDEPDAQPAADRTSGWQVATIIGCTVIGILIAALVGRRFVKRRSV